MRWMIIWEHPAARELDGMASAVRDRVLDAVSRFAVTGRGDLKRLQAASGGECRLRVGDYCVRLLFDHSRRIIYVLHVLHRGEAYRH